MKITEIWPEHWPGGNVVARFNINVTSDLRLIGLKLKRRRDGSHMVVPPNLRGAAVFHIGPDLARQIAAAAVAALSGGRAPGDYAIN